MRLLFFIIFMCSLSLLWAGRSRTPEPEYIRLVHRSMDAFIKEAARDYGLLCFGKGGALMDNIEKINLSFDTKGPLSLEQARLLILTLSEKYLKQINGNERMKPYLANDPFLPTNLEFGITLVDNRGNVIKNKGSSKSLLCHILLVNGRVVYSISNEEKVTYQTVLREPYEEALAIVRREHPELFPVGN